MKCFNDLLLLCFTLQTITLTPTPIYDNRKTITIEHKREDPRIARVHGYLEEKASPLMDSASDFIRVADKEKLDWKLLVAISGQESGFETAGNTSDFNAWGYMCGNNPCVFSSYKEGIETVGRTISRGSAYARYRESGSLYDLAVPYNYVSPENWTEKVQYFINQI